jgi:choice-of-anchor C domain-containing protein
VGDHQGGIARHPGWTVFRGSVDWKGAYWKSSHGRRSLDLNGDEPGGIRQDFASTPGRRYCVTFDMAGNPALPDIWPPVKKLRVRAAGQSADFEFDVRGNTIERMGWVGKRWEFTAVAPSTTLEIESLDAAGPVGPALDNVAVVPVAAPNRR